MPIALGILAASGQLSGESLACYEFLGELALGGELRGVRGILPAALACREAQRALLVPQQNADEATLVSNLPVFGVTRLLTVCAHLQKDTVLTPHIGKQRRQQKMAGRDLSV